MKVYTVVTFGSTREIPDILGVFKSWEAAVGFVNNINEEIVNFVKDDIEPNMLVSQGGHNLLIKEMDLIENDDPSVQFPFEENNDGELVPIEKEKE